MALYFTDLLEWLFGCSHRKMTFPRTHPASIGVDGREASKAETYVVCSECGRQFNYDWNRMRITGKRENSVTNRGEARS